MNPTYEKFIDAEVLFEQAEKARRSLNIFLAGPFIDVNEAETHANNTSSAAAIARYAIYQHLKSEGNNVLLGEHKRLEEPSKVKFGKNSNAVLFERSIIRNKKVDAVILLPSSPGSFLEFGDWANSETIGKKLFVIVDKQYEKDVNYLNLGTVKLAIHKRAVVRYLDYNNIDELKTNIKEYLDDIVAKQNMDKEYVD